MVFSASRSLSSVFVRASSVLASSRADVVTFDRAFGQPLLEFRVRSRELRDRIVAGDVVALDRAFRQTLFEFGVRAGEFGDRVVPRGIVALDRTFREALFEFRVGSGEFRNRVVARDIVAFDRAFGQPLLEFRVRAGKFRARVVAGDVVTFHRSLGQPLREDRVGAGEFGEGFVARDVVAFDRAFGEPFCQFAVGAGQFGDRTAAGRDVAPNIRKHHHDAHAGSNGSKNAEKWRDQITSTVPSPWAVPSFRTIETVLVRLAGYFVCGNGVAEVVGGEAIETFAAGFGLRIHEEPSSRWLEPGSRTSCPSL